MELPAAESTNFFRVFVSQLLGNLAVMNQLTGSSIKPAELVNWMEFGKTGCPLLYLGTTILLNWAICIAVDCAINYPMSKARAQATLHKLLHALIRPVTVRVSEICNFCLRRRSRITNSEGLTAVGRQDRRCNSHFSGLEVKGAANFITGKVNNRALCLHVKVSWLSCRICLFIATMVINNVLCLYLHWHIFCFKTAQAGLLIDWRVSQASAQRAY